MICTMEAPSTKPTGYQYPKNHTQHLQQPSHPQTGSKQQDEEKAVVGPTQEPLPSSPEIAPRNDGSLTSSLMAVAPFASFAEDDLDNRMAQVIQRFARCRVLWSESRSANRALEKEKRNSITHPSLLWRNEDGSVATRRVSSITMTDFEDSSGSHHFVNFGMRSNTIMCPNHGHGSKNNSSASSGHMSSLSEMSSHFGDFRFEPEAPNAYTEPMNDCPLQMPTRAGSMSTISSHSYSTLTTQSTLSRVLGHLPATAEEEGSTSTDSEGNNGDNESKKSKKFFKPSGSWDGFDAMPARRFIPPAPARSLGDSPLQKPRRKSSFTKKRE